MKLLKKVAALAAMAAVCITMAVPVSAKAAASCPPHLYTEQNHRVDIVDTSTHIISYVVENEDGEEEVYRAVCIIEWEEYIYDMVCLNCGSISYRHSSVAQPAHRNNKCSEYGIG